MLLLLVSLILRGLLFLQYRYFNTSVYEMFLLLGVLQVTVKKLVKESSEELLVSDSVDNLFCGRDFSVPTVRRSKLVVVDLAGSERIDKSGLF